MPFKRDFERRVNENMMGEKAEASSTAKAREAELDHDDEDVTFSENHHTDSKEAPPPRFSTLFTTPPPLKQPTPPTPIFESYPQSRQRSAGIFVPLPLLIIIAVLFLFESTVLFAYTIIGLYNTAPSRFLGLMNIPADNDAAMCNCPAADHQPAQAPINFAPNFMIPQQIQASQQATITNTFTVTVKETASLDISSVFSNMLATMTTATSTSTSTSSSSTASSSTSTVDIQSQASQMASDIMSMMATMTTSTSTTSMTSSSSTESSTSDDGDGEGSTVFKTVNPTPTVSSTTYIYVNEDGSTEAGPQSTIYSTKIVKAKRTAVVEHETGSMTKVKRDTVLQPTSLVAMSLEDALAK
ncbi:hypothetical protein K431DRAFT_342917 [Polychaeton citri CBS 116435]|uniref:Uncharacterized protein n=1 Tax=Polychaeton citri CBS 116435 TaxID=1314669 RepID=A0A9P4URC5_9PEZI|nr:hypothetical protein K431DRAFT_342917 [Polychaeton citri CBS 116435]